MPVKPPLGELKIGNQFVICPRRGTRIGEPQNVRRVEGNEPGSVAQLANGAALFRDRDRPPGKAERSRRAQSYDQFGTHRGKLAIEPVAA